MAGGMVKLKRPGVWQIAYDVGRDSEGKRIRKWETLPAKNKTEAQAALRKRLTELDTGTYVEPSKLTVADWLRQWLRDVASAKTQNKTFERYAEICERHLMPALGHHLLQKLHPTHIQGYYAKALKSGRCDGAGGLAEQTVLHHHRVLANALKAAVRLQVLMRNPTEGVEPPTPEEKEMVTLTEEQVGRLLDVVSGSQLYMPVLISVATGLRRGEVLGLRWKDLRFDPDPEKCTLSVRQSVEDTRQGIAIKPPKTKKSRRTIPIPPVLVEELRRHQTEQKKQRFALGPGYDVKADLVCARLDGRLMDPSEHISRGFAWLWGGQRVGRKEHLPIAGDIPRCRYHDLRHTHASMLIKQGVHMKVISERLGHGSIGITMDTYGHLLPGVQEQAMVGFEQTMRAVTRKKA